MANSAGIKKYFGNTAWLVSGRVIQMGINFLTGIFIARYLGPSKYGLIMFAVSFCLIFQIFVTLGLNSVLLRNLAHAPNDRDVTLGTAFGMQIVGGVVAMGIIAVVTRLSHVGTEASILIFMFSLRFLFMSTYGIRSFFESQVKAKYSALPVIIQSVLVGLLKIYFLWIRGNVYMFMACWLAEAVFTAIGLICFYKQQGYKFSKWGFSLSTARDLFKSSAPLMLSGMAVIIYQQIDRVMLKAFLNNESVGYYAVALNFCKMVFFIPLLASRSLAPSLINARKRSSKLYEERVQLFFDVLVWFAIVVALGMTLVAPFVIGWIYGAEYSPAVMILQVAAWKGVFMAMNASSGQVIVIERLEKYVPLRTGFGLLVNIALNVFLIPRYGAVGAAWATVISLYAAGLGINFFIRPLRKIFFMQCSTLVRGPQRIFQYARQHYSGTDERHC